MVFWQCVTVFLGSQKQLASVRIPSYGSRVLGLGIDSEISGSSYSSFGSSILILIFYMVMMREGVEPGCCGVSEE